METRSTSTDKTGRKTLTLRVKIGTLKGITIRKINSNVWRDAKIHTKQMLDPTYTSEEREQVAAKLIQFFELMLSKNVLLETNIPEDVDVDIKMSNDEDEETVADDASVSDQASSVSSSSRHQQANFGSFGLRAGRHLKNRIGELNRGLAVLGDGITRLKDKLLTFEYRPHEESVDVRIVRNVHQNFRRILQKESRFLRDELIAAKATIYRLERNVSLAGDVDVVNDDDNDFSVAHVVDSDERTNQIVPYGHRRLRCHPVNFINIESSLQPWVRHQSSLTADPAERVHCSPHNQLQWQLYRPLSPPPSSSIVYTRKCPVSAVESALGNAVVCAAAMPNPLLEQQNSLNVEKNERMDDERISSNLRFSYARRTGRKMWLCLLIYCCVEIVASSSFPTTTLSNRSEIAHVPQSNYRSMPNRRGHERDLMVVLPVMQGDPMHGDSNLQHLYTKAPITRIIDENSQQTRDLPARSTTSRSIERRIDLAAFETNLPSSAKRLQNRQDRHPAVDVSMADKSATPKSYKLPLDYGYPDSFKFVQELNELPKNHKPNWASSEQVDSTDRKSLVAASSTSHTQPPSTKNDPFQMFESVKPLEINKLLSLKQSAIGVTDSLPEENTTLPKKKHQESTKRPSVKRPTKKPQKNKPNGYKVAGFGQVPIVIDLGTTWRPPTSVIATDATSRFDPIAPQYSTLFETTKLFLPTPYTIPFENPTTKTIVITSTAAPSTTAQSTESTTSTTVATVNATTLAPNFEWTNVTVSAGTTTSNSMLKSAMAEVKPSDLVSLNKLLGADDVTPSTSGPLRDITTKHPFPNDMLTNDMKNMLIALGILRAENNEPIFAVPTPSTSTTKNVLAMLATQKSMPTIDPYSYISFKKIPDKSSVSDDMRDFLASFGLLPKQMTSNRGGFRQQRRLENSSVAKTRTARNSHIFRPVAELSQINSYDARKARKVNDAIDTIRKLSSNKNGTANLSIEQLEKQLENVTASLRETDDNEELARTADRTVYGDAKSTTTAAPTSISTSSTVNETIPVRRQKPNYKLSAIIKIAKPTDENKFKALVLATPSKMLSSNQLSNMMRVISGMTQRESHKSSTSSPSIAESYRVELSKNNKSGRQMTAARAARPIGAHLVDSNRFQYVKM